MKWACLLLFGGFGLAALAWGLGWGAKRWRLQRDGVRTEGTVVELYESESTETENGHKVRSIAYYPVVEFNPAGGAPRRFRGSTGSGAPEYEVGAKVPVLYRRDDPADAQVADFEQFWLGPAAISLFGLLFLGGGVAGFFLIADSDRAFGPAFEQRMARADLMEGGRGVVLDARVAEVRPTREGPVLVCRGGVPGAEPSDFLSAPLAFDPGSAVVGRAVKVYADPQDAKRYFVHVDPLFQQPR